MSESEKLAKLMLAGADCTSCTYITGDQIYTPNSNEKLFCMGSGLCVYYGERNFLSRQEVDMMKDLLNGL